MNPTQIDTAFEARTPFATYELHLMDAYWRCIRTSRIGCKTRSWSTWRMPTSTASIRRKSETGSGDTHK